MPFPKRISTTAFPLKGLLSPVTVSDMLFTGVRQGPSLFPHVLSNELFSVVTFAPESHNNCTGFSCIKYPSSSFPRLLSCTISDLTFSKVELRSPNLTFSRFPVAVTWAHYFAVPLVGHLNSF